MKAVQKKWLIILGLSVLYSPIGVSVALFSTFLIAWLDDDILHQTCTYDQCPLKYDIWFWGANILVVLVSFLAGCLMYYFLKKLWVWMDSKEKKHAATS